MNGTTTTTAQSHRLARLKAGVEFPEAWKPAEGETLVGTVDRWELVAYTPKGTGEERTCETLVLKDEDGREHAIWTFHARLRYALIAPKEEVDRVIAEGRPRLAQPGDLVAVHFIGMRPMDSGKDAAAYRVAIDTSGRISQEGSDAAHAGETARQEGGGGGGGDFGDIPFQPVPDGGA